jgi:small subunit ribosomal protein S18
MQPKNKERLLNFRRANRKLPRRRMDIPTSQLVYKNPDLLSKFTTETGKILPRRVTGVSAWIHRKITREIKRARAVNIL